MSANDWSVCPKCVKVRLEKVDEAESDLKQAYGKKDFQEYQELEQQVEEIKAQSDGITLRESWEIRTDERGVFSMWYKCCCDTCGFKFSFNHEEKIL